MSTGEIIAATIVIWVLLFLLFRALWLWYWRVNHIVELLKGIDEKLDRIANASQASGQGFFPERLSATR